MLLITACQRRQQQNFVVILVDDLGWNDVGYAGSKFYETPNIDRFSSESFLFTQAYASAPVCSPSRAAILTGKHPVRVGITDWLPGLDPHGRKLIGPQDHNELSLSEVTFPEILKENGYLTFFAGKWHLGAEGFLPTDQGFQYNLGGYEKGSPVGGYYSPYSNPMLKDGIDDEYLTDRLTNESIEFIEKAGDDPFLLFLSFYTVHTPIEPNLEYVDDFISKPTSTEGNKFLRDKKKRTRQIQSDAAYASMVYAMDHNVGKILNTLREADLYNNTTIIFTSDNGGLSISSSDFEHDPPTSVLPLNGGKGWLYEGGTRVPFLIKPANTSSFKVIDTPVIGHDLLPTILSMAGIDYSEQEIDGVDLTDLFNQQEKLKPRSLFWHYPHYHGSAWTPGAAIRSGQWKLLEFYETGRIELYNLEKDEGELIDLKDKYPEKSAELIKKLHAWQEKLGAQMPQANPNYSKELLN